MSYKCKFSTLYDKITKFLQRDSKCLKLKNAISLPKSSSRMCKPNKNIFSFYKTLKLFDSKIYKISNYLTYFTNKMPVFTYLKVFTKEKLF